MTNPESEKDEEVKVSPPAPKPKPKPKPPASVRPVEKQGRALLVEWSDKDGLRRATVRRDDVIGNKIDPDKLAQGNPYGQRWSEEIEGISPELERALYARGIWTKADLLERSQLARGAVMEIVGVPLIKKLLEFAKSKEV